MCVCVGEWVGRYVPTMQKEKKRKYRLKRLARAPHHDFIRNKKKKTFFVSLMNTTTINTFQKEGGGRKLVYQVK